MYLRERETLISLLEENNINVISYPIMSIEYKITCDGHPNAKLNKILSSKLVEDLNIKENNKAFKTGEII